MRYGSRGTATRPFSNMWRHSARSHGRVMFSSRCTPPLSTPGTSSTARVASGALPGPKAFELPFQLGREVAGTVADVGAGVTRFSVGDRVVRMTCPACGQCGPCIRGDDNLCTNIGIPGHQVCGGYADYVVAPEQELLAAPDNLSFEELAFTLWSYGTVWRMMHGRSGSERAMTYL
jgi:D-arabinose 1-dehydrogenase-like Zn-dependent alcohol dehydrogenase